MLLLKNIHKTYHAGSPLHVLKGINLEIEKGEFVSIMGASGSGKSTLLNIMGILDDYDEGEYYLDGRLIRGLNETQAAAARNRMIGFIFQSFNLINYKNAMRILKSKLYQRELEKRQAIQAQLEGQKKKIEWGSQIRSYVFDDRRVKDHRTGHQTSDVERVMDGEIDDFIKAYLMEFGASAQ